MLKNTHTEMERIEGGKEKYTIHLRPIAFHNAYGQLQRITNALASTGDPKLPVGVDELIKFRVRDKLVGNAPVVHFGRGGTHVRYAPLGTNNVDGIVDGNSITFPEAWGNADLKLTAAGHKLQKDIALRSGHPQTFSFRIDSHEGFDPNTLSTADFKVYPPVLRHPMGLIPSEKLNWIVTEEGGKTILTVNLPEGDHAGKVLDPTFGPVEADTGDGKDLKLLSDNYTENYDADLLIVGEVYGGSYSSRSLIHFDLTDLPDRPIISSVVSMYVVTDWSNNERVYRFFRVLAARDWVENEAAYQIYKTGTNWSNLGAYGSGDTETSDIGATTMPSNVSTGAYYDFDSLTPTTKAGLDLGEGWLIKADTESDDAYRFGDSEATDAGWRPYLTVVYAPAIQAVAGVQTLNIEKIAGLGWADIEKIAGI